MIRYVVMVWHQDGLTRAPAVYGAWTKWASADKFAEAVMKRWPLLLAEPTRMVGKLMRDVDPDPDGSHSRT